MRVLLALLSATFALVAYGQQYDVMQEGAKTYASELFGPGSANLAVDYQGNAPTLTLRLTLTQAQGAATDMRDAADVTMTLANATLARSVRASDFTITVPQTSIDDPGTPNTVPMSVRDRQDGARGDNAVTFEVVSTGTLSLATGTIVEFDWKLPPLMGLNPNRPVTATVEVDAAGGSGFPNSRAATVGVNTHQSTTGVLRRAGPMGENGVRQSIPLISFKPALTFSTSGGGNARIDLAGGRTQIQPASAGSPAQAYLGNVTVGVSASDALQLDGRTFSIGRRQNGEGDLLVSVSGQFHGSGDDVWLDLNGNNALDNGEALSLRGGMMSGRFSLLEVAGDTRITGESAEQERLSTEGVATRRLIYRPNGTDTLRPSTYRSNFSVDFDANQSADKAVQTTTLTTEYTVVAATGQAAAAPIVAMRQAPAVPPINSVDVGNIRVKCEVSTDCTIYLECDDATGESWFVQLPEPIPGRSTLRLTSENLAMHLGVAEEEGWDGRLSCAVMSTADISIQVLIRSGDVLVNNTYVDGGDN